MPKGQKRAVSLLRLQQLIKPKINSLVVLISLSSHCDFFFCSPFSVPVPIPSGRLSLISLSVASHVSSLARFTSNVSGVATSCQKTSSQQFSRLFVWRYLQRQVYSYYSVEHSNFSTFLEERVKDYLRLFMGGITFVPLTTEFPNIIYSVVLYNSGTRYSIQRQLSKIPLLLLNIFDQQGVHSYIMTHTMSYHPVAFQSYVSKAVKSKSNNDLHAQQQRSICHFFSDLPCSTNRI